MKKVSIIIPAYNKADLTVKAVESVLDQSYPNVEVIVVNDGSTEETRQRLLTYHEQIRYLEKENGGLFVPARIRKSYCQFCFLERREKYWLIRHQ